MANPELMGARVRRREADTVPAVVLVLHSALPGA
eukprot:COSAG01_NODE_43057_length_433_cov_3.365269_2_plen_33_part_01